MRTKKQTKEKRYIAFCKNKECGKKYNRKLRTTRLCDDCREKAYRRKGKIFRAHEKIYK